MACRERTRCREGLALGLRRWLRNWGEALALPRLRAGSGAQRRGDLRAVSGNDPVQPPTLGRAVGPRSDCKSLAGGAGGTPRARHAQ